MFFLGPFMERLNAKGALAALLVGFMLGLFRLAVDTPVMLGIGGLANGYEPGSFLWIVNNMYFQYDSLLIFLVSAAVMAAVSDATEAPDPVKVAGLTSGTQTAAERADPRRSRDWRDVAGSAVVLVVILAAYLYFCG